MIFKQIIFPENSQKEKQIKKMEKQLISLFERYKIVWNEFSDIAGRQIEIPKLKKNIMDDKIEECIDEMNEYADILETKINAIVEKIGIKKFIVNNKNIQTNFNKKVIDKIAISIGVDIISGLATFILVYKKVYPLIRIMIQPSGGSVWSAYEKNINLENFDSRKIVDEKVMECYKNERQKQMIKYKYGVIKLTKEEFERGLELLDKGWQDRRRDIQHQFLGHKNRRINDIKNELSKQLMEENALYNDYKDIITDAEVVKILRKTNYKESMGNFLEIFIGKANNEGQYIVQFSKDFNKFYIGNGPYENYLMELGEKKIVKDYKSVLPKHIEMCAMLEDVDKVQINELADIADMKTSNRAIIEETELKIKNSGIDKWRIGVSIISVVIVVCIVDAITDFFVGNYESKKLNEQNIELNSLLSELSSGMEKVINNLSKLNQDLKDGVIYIYEDNILLVSDKNTLQLVDVYDVTKE
ncbi:MAG: hypothetical protein ACRCSG_03940 [Cellulosilyticaceae bacterium]